MAMITKSEFGVVAVNNDVLCKIVVEEMLRMDDLLVPCNRRGKPCRKSIFGLNDDMLSSVDVKEQRKTELSVKVYFIAKFGESINQMANDLFDRIEEEFELLCLDKPKVLTACVKGVLSRQLQERDVEVVRYND
ncbi:MAG: hypothetical protein KBS68_07920 [Clostridiales bacterium]|nr:hypothetical protein [Candidatus Crickella merdequi]